MSTLAQPTERVTKMFSESASELKRRMDAVNSDSAVQYFHTVWANFLTGKELIGNGVVLNFRLALHDFQTKYQYPPFIAAMIDMEIDNYLKAVIVDAPEVLKVALDFTAEVSRQVEEDNKRKEEARLGGMLNLLQGMLNELPE